MISSGALINDIQTNNRKFFAERAVLYNDAVSLLANIGDDPIGSFVLLEDFLWNVRERNAAIDNLHHMISFNDFADCLNNCFFRCIAGSTTVAAIGASAQFVRVIDRRICSKAVIGKNVHIPVLVRKLRKHGLRCHRDIRKGLDALSKHTIPISILLKEAAERHFNQWTFDIGGNPVFLDAWGINIPQLQTFHQLAVGTGQSELFA